MFSKSITGRVSGFLPVLFLLGMSFGWADHDERDLKDKSLTELAVQVELESVDLYREARNALHGRGSPREIAALDELRKLALEAKLYYRVVQERPDSRRGTYRDFEQLKQVHEKAESRLIYVTSFRHLREDCKWIGTLLGHIEEKYERENDPTRELPELAHRIEELARDIHEEAERSIHRPNYWQRRALLALHDLQEEAVHFHKQVEANASNREHTKRDYEKLEEAYETAQRRCELDLFDSQPDLRRGFENLGDLIEKAGRCYSGHDDHDPRDRHEIPHRH